MSNKKVGLALVGAGNVSKHWAGAIRRNRLCELKVVVDKDLRKAAVLSGQFESCKPTTKLVAAFKYPNVDAVIVATPHKYLAGISKKALLSNKHVLSEKPGGTTLKDIKEIIAASKMSGCYYMIGFNHRFHVGFLKAKKLCEQGLIGKILFIRSVYGFGGRPSYNKEWRFNKSVSGGGELMNQGVHMIDMARLFLGDFSEIKGFTPNLFWGGNVEDNGFVLMRTAQNQVVSIHVSWTNWKWAQTFEIVGSKGYLYINGLDQRYGGPESLTIGQRDPEFKKPPTEKVVVFDSESAEDSFSRQLKEFLTDIIQKRQPVPGGQDVCEVFKIIQKVYEKK